MFSSPTAPNSSPLRVIRTLSPPVDRNAPVTPDAGRCATDPSPPAGRRTCSGGQGRQRAGRLQWTSPGGRVGGNGCGDCGARVGSSLVGVVRGDGPQCRRPVCHRPGGNPRCTGRSAAGSLTTPSTGSYRRSTTPRRRRMSASRDRVFPVRMVSTASCRTCPS